MESKMKMKTKTATSTLVLSTAGSPCWERMLTPPCSSVTMVGPTLRMGIDTSSGESLFDKNGSPTAAFELFSAQLLEHETLRSIGGRIDVIEIHDIFEISDSEYTDKRSAHATMRALDRIAEMTGAEVVVYAPLAKGADPDPATTADQVMMAAVRRSRHKLLGAARHAVAVFGSGDGIFGAVKSNVDAELHMKPVHIRMTDTGPVVTLAA